MKIFAPKPGTIVAVALDPNPNTPPEEFQAWKAEADAFLVGAVFDWRGLHPFDWQLAFWAGCDPETAAQACCLHYQQEWTRAHDRRKAATA